MTVDAVRRTRRRTPAASVAPEPMLAPTPSIAIGEIDQTIFECPQCTRPLALGVGRCPGCGTRLVRGVALGKVTGFVAFGLAIGLLVGAGGGVAFGLTHPAITGPPAVGAAGPSAPPLTGSNGGGKATTAPTSAATSRPTTTPTDPAGIPPVARNALTQVIGTNARLASAEASLRAALRGPGFDASAVAQVLRSLSADAVFGEQIAAPIAGWSGSSTVGTELASYYAAVHETAANGLVSSVQNQAAYRAAATSMVKLLGELPTLDAAVRSTAASAGVDLPAASGAPATP